jgi:hypothetical protein
MSLVFPPWGSDNTTSWGLLNECYLGVDAFSERQTLNKNCGGALCTGADGPRAGPDGPRPGARRCGTLCAGADCPWPGAGRSAAWCAARAPA